MVNLVAMPVSRKEMEKHHNMHTRQVEHATKQGEARENKVANNKKRKEWVERQNNVNYRNEYDRMLHELAGKKAPFQTMSQLEHRDGNLRNLFSSGNV